MTQNEIDRMLLHDEQTAERVRMVARVSRKRVERERTLERRAARQAKWSALGRTN